MNEDFAKACTDAIIADESKRHGFRADPRQGKILDIIRWAQQNGATIWVILQNLQAAWKIINDKSIPDWIDKLQQIAKLFFPTNTPAISIPE